MRAVKEDAPWELVFPDTTHPAYADQWKGDIQSWRDAGFPVDVHATVPARELWQTIIESAHASAEPGVLFIDRVNADRPGGDKCIGCNPCAEQPLPAYSVCNLGHVNLSKFVAERHGLSRGQE